MGFRQHFSRFAILSEDARAACGGYGPLRLSAARLGPVRSGTPRIPIGARQPSDMLTAMETAAALACIEQELKKYVHPLLSFGAREINGRVELVIDLKHKPEGIHTYYLEIHPRDLASSQFPWTLQRMIFDGLHDYFIEMFVYTPQSIDNPDAPV